MKGIEQLEIDEKRERRRTQQSVQQSNAVNQMVVNNAVTAIVDNVGAIPRKLTKLKR